MTKRTVMQEKMLQKANGTAVIYGDNGKTRINGDDLLKSIVNTPWINFQLKNKQTHPRTRIPFGFTEWYVKYRTLGGKVKYSLCAWDNKEKKFLLPTPGAVSHYANLSHFQFIK